MDVKQKALEEHEKWQGEIEVISRATVSYTHLDVYKRQQ